MESSDKQSEPIERKSFVQSEFFFASTTSYFSYRLVNMSVNGFFLFVWVIFESFHVAKSLLEKSFI